MAMGAAGMGGLASGMGGMMQGVMGAMSASQQGKQAMAQNNLQAQQAINQHNAAKKLALVRRQVAITQKNQSKAEGAAQSKEYGEKASGQIWSALAARFDTGGGINGSGIEPGSGTTRMAFENLLRKAAHGKDRIAYADLVTRAGKDTEKDQHQWTADVEDVNITNVGLVRDFNNATIKHGMMMNIMSSLFKGGMSMASSMSGGGGSFGGYTASSGTPSFIAPQTASVFDTAPSYSNWSAPSFGWSSPSYASDLGYGGSSGNWSGDAGGFYSPSFNFTSLNNPRSGGW